MKLLKKDLKEALRLISDDFELLLPGEGSGVSRFALWDGGDIDLSYGNTQLPPKDILFPHTEKMYSFKCATDVEVTEEAEAKSRIVFGIRPCDMRAIECMDKVFLEKGFTDSFYSRKREHTLFIAMGCTNPCRTCFCDSMGLTPGDAPAADILLVESDDSFEVKAQTQRGKEIAECFGRLLTDGKVQVSKVSCALKTKMSDDLPEKLSGMFEHPIWDEVGRACIGCATCTYVCPTCYCFDISLDNHGSEGVSFRCWDSCMFSDYTRMAGGHNPRPTKKERVRNRYMHKLSYFNERYGSALCVGCGRCVEKCPANLDITEFIDKVAEVRL
ncbi:MAG: 4Fe-4S dicluster domain-containing protein [Oscillospiraceae bacterium]|nr:4Fe-4S dicluster domain-containing protein [Oscillospiraceae bacterium]